MRVCHLPLKPVLPLKGERKVVPSTSECRSPPTPDSCVRLTPSPILSPSTVISVLKEADSLSPLKSHFPMTAPMGMKRIGRTREIDLCSEAGGTGHMLPSAFPQRELQALNVSFGEVRGGNVLCCRSEGSGLHLGGSVKTMFRCLCLKHDTWCSPGGKRCFW